MKSIPNKSEDLLLAHLNLLKNRDTDLPVLDLACGEGRNGLVLARLGIPVVFADRSTTALEVVQQQIKKDSLPCQIWQVDLEQADINPFNEKCFSAIIGFRYLHRPLFPALLKAVIPGGLVIYETFTTDNRRFGRPNNPDFLLQTGELEKIFREWELIHYFEGTLQKPDRAVAQIVASKP